MKETKEVLHLEKTLTTNTSAGLPHSHIHVTISQNDLMELEVMQ